MMKKIENEKQFEDIVKKEGKAFFVFYTDSSEKSKKALDILKKVENAQNLYSINAKEVKVHKQFGINMVPAFLILKNGKKEHLALGLQSKEHYETLISGKTLAARKSSGKQTLRVVVYTSNGCPWCDKAKNHLKKHGIPFREVNVSNKPKEAQKLVQRTGQRGTPQLDIGGQFVVGFDVNKINRLLGIKG